MKSSISKIGILFVAVILLSSADMFGQNRDNSKSKERPTFEQLLEKMDENDDGKLSLKEVKGPLADHFDQIDANEDGFITEEEFSKAPKPKGKKH